MAYIIGTYNKFDAWDRAHSVYKFELNGNWYAIKEIEMVWGLPMLEYQVDRDDVPESYRIYERVEDAMEFVRKVQCANTY